MFRRAFVGVLLAAIVALLAAIFAGMGMDPTMATALSGFIVAAIFGAVAWMMIQSGINAVKATNLEPRHTARAISEDMHAVEEKFQ